MTSPSSLGRCFGTARKLLGSFLCALALLAAPTGASADGPTAQFCLGGDTASATPAALSRPVAPEGGIEWEATAYRGLSCSRCNAARQYCVLNPIRYEYACAPLGTVACISASRTHWCPPHRGCWAGRCR